MSEESLKVAMVQMAPIWLNKEKTINKIKSYLSDAGKHGADLVIFGESLLPGYPYWVAMTDGARFNNTIQKSLHAHYMRAAIRIEDGDLDNICLLESTLKRGK